MHSYFILTICDKKYEIATCIINVWGYMEILPFATIQIVVVVLSK